MAISRLGVISGALLLVGVTLLGQQRSAAPAAVGAQQGSGAPRGDIEQGRYLVERVVMCFECHSTRDAAGNIVPGTKFLGGSMPMRPPWPADWPSVIPRIGSARLHG